MRETPPQKTGRPTLPLTRTLSLADAAQAAQAQQWLSLECQQLSKGRFHGILEAIDLGGVELFHERHEQRVHKIGSTPNGQCTISLIDRADGSARFSQFPGDPTTSLFYLPGDTAFDIVVPAGRATSYVRLNQIDLLTGLAALNRPLADRLIEQGDLQSLGIRGKEALENSFRVIRALSGPIGGMGAGAATADTGSRISLRRTLLEHMLDAVNASAEPVAGTAPTLHARRRTLQIVRTARERAASMLDQRQAPTVADLCMATGVSARTLQYAFQDQLEMTPRAYLKLARLNGARAELLQADPRETSLTAVATHWGFLHIGRFTQAYRQLFCEAPKANFGRDYSPGMPLVAASERQRRFDKSCAF